MKIAESNILMTSTRNLSIKKEEKTSLEVWVDSQNPATLDYKVDLSPKAGSGQTAEDQDCAEDMDMACGPGITIRKLLAELLSGKEIKLVKIARSDESPAADEVSSGPLQTSQAPQKSGWGISIEQQQKYSEKEQVAVTAAGIIKTSDQKEISFSLKLSMDREFVSESNLSFRAGDALLKDPLIINYDGNAADLEGGFFQFDLDADGAADRVPLLRKGSGFLCLDTNCDGVINNGSELFGPETGDGFAELSKYDSDANNWIDENDPVYCKLGMWTVNDDRTANLRKIRDYGIGAIYLGQVNSEFDLKNTNDQLTGRVRNTGLFLKEDGTPGSVQQIDLVV